MHAPTLQNERTLNPLVVVGALLVAVAVLPFDVALARFFMSDPFPGELRSLVHKTEFFGHAYGIIGIAFTIYLLCDDRRRQLPRLLCTSLSAGLACNLVKMSLHRTRPVDYVFSSDDPTFLGLSFLHAETISEIFRSEFHSFPSAHSATAIAFAMVLGAMFPKASKWFLFLAIMVAISRFDGGAHFVSDTFVGGVIGYLVAWRMMSNSAVSKRFSAFERGRLTLIQLLTPAMKKSHAAEPYATAFER